MLYDFINGQTSVVLRVKLRDSTSSSGAGLTGLTYSSSGLIISTIADVEASATAYTVAASHIQTIATLGTFAAPSASNCRFKEVDSTNHPGLYELQIADARFAVTNAKSLTISLSGATNLAQCDVVIPLRAVNPYLATFGLASVNLNLAQVGLSPRDLGTVADSALTVGDALVAAIGVAAGKETVVGAVYTVKTPSTGTVIRTFSLDSTTAPTSRS